MESFTTHTGRVALLDWSDVNTDLIIPARYLKRIERTGYGPLLFADKRYTAGGAPQADEPEKHGAYSSEFPLNDAKNEGATVLLVGRNFGCGSSREHAVWAVAQAGYRAVIAPGKDEGFADIFEGNAFQNGLLPIELDPADWAKIVSASKEPGGASVTIDLQDQSVTLNLVSGGESRFCFEVPESHRQRLLKGLDAIGETLQNETAIAQHERRMPAWVMPAQATA